MPPTVHGRSQACTAERYAPRGRTCGTARGGQLFRRAFAGCIGMPPHSTATEKYQSSEPGTSSSRHSTCTRTSQFSSLERKKLNFVYRDMALQAATGGASAAPALAREGDQARAPSQEQHHITALDPTQSMTTQRERPPRSSATSRAPAHSGMRAAGENFLDLEFAF